MGDLYDPIRRENLDKARPLADRMRPRTLEEFVGQRHLLGEGKLLRRLIEADRVQSAVFYGPPGTGKTTLAEVIARTTGRSFERAHAAAVGVREVRGILERARRRLEDEGRGTILFLDEIHRFARNQQDVLLADVEAGRIVLIGATTENPFFTLTSALVSRSQIFAFEPLSEEEVLALLRRALADEERGLGRLPLEVEDEALTLLARYCDGDARRALTALEVAALSTRPGESGRIRVDRATAAESIQRKAPLHDRAGDAHYDLASAFIKSMRGSDPDAALYWLARMLEGGEDPRFVARRLAIFAAEDIGNADPQALVLAQAAFDLVCRIGMPEAQLVLAQATTYLACAPKSKASALAIWSALDDVKHARTVPVPKVLRDAHYRGAKRLGHGEGYRSPHDRPPEEDAIDYLGVDRTYYEPTDRGREKEMRAFLESLRRARRSQRGEGGGRTAADEGDD